MVRKGHRAHPPSLCSGRSLSVYSQNMNHIIIVSAFHRLPKSSQLFPRSLWEGEDGEMEGIPAAVATGVRVL